MANNPSQSSSAADQSTQDSAKSTWNFGTAQQTSNPGKDSVDSMPGATQLNKSTGQLFGGSEGSNSTGFFSNTTSMFGSWFSKLTDGEKANISSKDLNAFAPTSF